ncbi:spaetzle-processing enzyme-like [Musca vetustissima]|uniref:spaetzle-processing enzyme-like n=1 Tax=Musca vetustissima TaxID=27455 RepID=UPI002AB6E1E9|nr:spaetzle-processing enzyme-like [Musca vetustissima]
MCPILYEQFQSFKQLTKEEQAFIRNSQCGYDDRIEDRENRVLVCCPQNTEQCGVVKNTASHLSAGSKPIDAKIPINGGEYPWMALIEYEFKEDPRRHEYICSGSLINSNYILTAAHCVTNKKWTAKRIWLGHSEQNNIIECSDQPAANCPTTFHSLEIDKIFIHPKYPENLHHDIALIRLESYVEFSQFIRPICLPFDKHLKSEKLINTLAEFASWGADSQFEGIKSTTQFKMHLKIWDTKVCRQKYRTTFYDVNVDYDLCAGGVEGVDTCLGDSGGALMHSMHAGHREKKYFVIGVMSYGKKECGLKGWPSVSVDVQRHLPWILAHWRQ